VGIVREDDRAEVDELEDATLRVDDADVGRLDVAMRDAEVGEEGERVEHLDGEGPDRACVPVLSARARAKCLEVHVVRQDGRVEALVHEKEVLAVVEAVEQPHNVPAAAWIMQPDQSLNPGLAQPGIHLLLVVLQALECYGPVLGAFVHGAEDGGKGARAEDPVDLVAARL
jgi:hypothetical protein